jgi:hypothetical protein
MQLTTHFTLEEATASATAAAHNLDNQPPSDGILYNIKKTASMMEQVRSLLGDHPIVVSSWYRSPEVNKLVGGVANSAHASGLAVDFTCPDFGSIVEVCHKIATSDIQFDQLIWEFGSWVHIGFCNCPKPRRETLTIHKGGNYIAGLPAL